MELVRIHNYPKPLPLGLRFRVVLTEGDIKRGLALLEHYLHFLDGTFSGPNLLTDFISY